MAKVKQANVGRVLKPKKKGKAKKHINKRIREKEYVGQGR